MAFWVVQFLNGLQFSMLLFILAVGLTVIFGLLHFVNLAHGSLYAVGAYIGYMMVQLSGSYWFAFLFAPLTVMLLGMVIYYLIIRRVRHAGPMNQVLVTFGLIFVLLDACRYFWGDIALSIDPPTLLQAQLTLGAITYPLYRIFIIMLGLAIMGALSLALSYSMIGTMIRAGVDNRDMAISLGIHVEKIFFLVFCIGCLLAGLAGVVSAPILSITPYMGIDILIPTLIVIVIGGLGSLKGAIIGSLLVGFTQTFGAVFAPQLAAILVYAVLAVILILKPEGLFPSHASNHAS